MAFTIISCKKKTTTRTLGNPNPIGPETPGADFDDDDACAFPLALAEKVKVNPNKLKVDSIRFIPSGDAYTVVVNEPVSAPAADLIAYEVCYQEQENACKTYLLETYLDLRNSQLEAGTAKVTTFACCNESDGRCEGTNGPKRSFGASRAERDYYCSEDVHDFIQIQPKTSGLQLSSGSDQQNLYLIELDNRLERAAWAAWNIFDEIIKGSKQPQIEYPAYLQLKNDGFEAFLIELRANGLEYAQSIIQYSQQKASKKDDSRLQLTNSDDDCLPDDDFTYDPLDNPYDDDPGDYTPPENPLDDDEDETEEVATDSDETDNSEELQELCLVRGREYADLECGEVKWLFDSKECMVYPKDDEPYVIDPLLEPQFTSCVVGPSNSEQSEGKFWKVTGGLSIAVGAVALTGGLASIGYDKYKARKYDADIKVVDEDGKNKGILNADGSFNEENYKKATPEIKQEYNKNISEQIKLETKENLVKQQGLADELNKFTDPSDDLRKAAEERRKLDIAIADKKAADGSGDRAQADEANRRLEAAKTSYVDARDKLGAGTQERRAQINAELNRQDFFSKNSISDDISVEEAKKKIEQRKLVLEEFDEIIQSKEPSRFKTAQDILDGKHNFRGGLSVTDAEDLFGGKAGSPLARGAGVVAVSNPDLPPANRNKYLNSASNYAVNNKGLLQKRALRWGGAAFAVGILATTLFSLAQDRVASLIARLTEIENYIIDTLLQIDACEKDASKCFDPTAKK